MSRSVVQVAVDFAAGHRVMGHENKCRHLHGHNWRVVVHVAAPSLDHLGRVVDFSVLKQAVKQWIDTSWDHGFLLHAQDAEALAAMHHIHAQRVFVLDRNPTAENLAKYLLDVVLPQLLAARYNDPGERPWCDRVDVWETPTSCATARP